MSTPTITILSEHDLARPRRQTRRPLRVPPRAGGGPVEGGMAVSIAPLVPAVPLSPLPRDGLRALADVHRVRRPSRGAAGGGRHPICAVGEAHRVTAPLVSRAGAASLE